ncbi:hypothetical protein [Streptomyces anulatus]|uniref:hypothetical protein n=1 Tax=Streptomyces anulatus TaxID=1892 RepID=UPI0036B636B9
MDSVAITPGLTLTDTLYETAATGALAFTPDLALTWEKFIEPTSWWLIPDGTGRLSKAELTLLDTREHTVKINLWYAPDIRDANGRPAPHSHPWPFTSQILTGGYSEDRYTLSSTGIQANLGCEHTQGQVNKVDRDLYHEVTALHAGPGATITLMMCGRGERGSWGHFDPATGTVTPPERDPLFPQRLRTLNPHRREAQRLANVGTPEEPPES